MILEVQILGPFLAKTLDDKYLSPRSQTIVTMTPFSSFYANLMVAAIAAPLLTPAKIAYSLASRIIISSAYSWDTSMISSTLLLSKIFGK